MKKKAMTIVPNKAPAVEREWPTQQQVQGVTKKFDRLVSHCERLRALNKELRTHMSEASLGAAEYLIGLNSDSDLSAKTKALENEMNALDPDHWWDENGNIQRSLVSIVLANLMVSFPTSNIPDPDAFTRLLLDDVMDLEPLFPELETACRKLRTSKKFMPAAWQQRYEALDCVEGEHTEATELLTAKLKRHEAEKQRRDAEQKRREEISAARALPICVGDRVRHSVMGLGTVTAVIPPKTSQNIYIYVVDFGGETGERGAMRCSLERLAESETDDASRGGA